MNIPSIKIRAGLWLLLLTGLILVGCAPKQRAVDDSFAFGNDYENLTGPDRSTMTPEERFAYDYRSAAVARMRDEGVPLSNVHLVERAKTAIGTPYVRGGTSMSGFDCSGFVQWAYKSVGVSLPRTAREQSVLGTPIDSDEMEAGDIVLSGIPGVGIIQVYTLGTANSSTAPGAARAWRSPPSAILISVQRSSAPAV